MGVSSTGLHGNMPNGDVYVCLLNLASVGADRDTKFSGAEDPRWFLPGHLSVWILTPLLFALWCQFHLTFMVSVWR